MTLAYGFAKAKMTSAPGLKGSRHGSETQYHLHFGLSVAGAEWDIAVNVGTNNAGDLLKYKLISNYRHPLTGMLTAAGAGRNDLTGQHALPALDYMRSDILADTDDWQNSEIMNGSDTQEPAASLSALLQQALSGQLDVCVFGRFYTEGDGVHDTHMNQGSTGSFLNDGVDDHNDHNDVWQDGAVLVDLGDAGWTAYFAAFNQQLVPTDDLGNPLPGAATI